MELEDLKQSWSQSMQNLKPFEPNIMELIQKSHGPVAKLERRFRKGIILIPIVVSLIILTLSKKHDIFHDALFWSYIAFCLSMFGYFLYNYQLIKKLGLMNGNVKAKLEEQVQIPQKAFRSRLVFVRCSVVYFMLLLEILMYYQQEPALLHWHKIPIGLRLTAYAAAFILLYFLTKTVLTRKYGRHISHLKQLVQQMQ